MIKAPYLLFIGEAHDPLSIKLAKGVADWRPDLAIGEYALPSATVSTGMPAISIKEAVEKGAKTFVLGFTNSGGTIDQSWVPDIIKAIESGMDVASGLHQKLESIDEIKHAAIKHNVKLIDVRHPTQEFKTGTGIKRRGKRILTVGTDCSVGKMYTALALEKELKKQNQSATFQATGQCGIFIAGKGVAIDCVVSDFISGAVEYLAPENDEDHWDVIEGQGSLLHPAFAGVSLGLLHGSQADHLVLCHAEKRDHMRGIPGQKLPSFEETLAINLELGRLTNPKIQFAGICINTSMLDASEADKVCQNYQEKYSLPCVDPIRHGVSRVIENILK